MQITQQQLDSLLARVRRPSRYIGGEVNSFNKPWDPSTVKWALVFPDAYEVGMSHVGLSVLYEILNLKDGVLADRVFVPWLDMEQAMREEEVPLWGLESRRELKDFDIVGITLPYELTYTNILTLLDLSGILFRAKDRGDEFPIIIGGGVGAFNHSPVEEFFDAFVIGDGEGVVGEMSEAVNSEQGTGAGKKKRILEKLAKISGVHVPSGRKVCVPGSHIPGSSRAIITDLDAAHYPKRPVVPYMQVIHDRVAVEIQRGCVRGCRFCQAGFTYRPLRQRSPERIKELACEGIDSTGHEELSFLSLSAGDYEGLAEIMNDMSEEFGGKWVNFSLPSLRVETLTPAALTVLKRSLHGGFTLAPEAATDRLRNVINKGNTEEELLSTIDKVFSSGWRQLKLYFMIGLPTETDDDVRAIATLANKAYDIGRRHRRDVTITVSVSTFVPKPFTPFQWAAQISIDETKRRQDILKGLLRRRGMELRWHDANLSFLEGVFARGDARLGKVIEAAWKRGARFDAWDETFKPEAWADAFKECGIEPGEYLKERDVALELPWQGMFAELSGDFLKEEYKKAMSGEVTPDCMNGKCSGCGVCGRDVKNDPAEGWNDGVTSPMTEQNQTEQFAPSSVVTTLNFTYTKTGRTRWLSHLELMQVLRRAFRRAGLPTVYSQGFHPHMKLSLKNALKVGQASEREEGSVVLTAEVDKEEMARQINRQLPEGVKLKVIFAL